MTPGFENAEAVELPSIGNSRIEAGDREPLPCHGVPILATGKADVAPVDTAQRGQRVGHRNRGRTPLLDPQEGVRAVSRRRIQSDLLDLEVIVCGADSRQKSPRFARQRRRERLGLFYAPGRGRSGTEEALEDLMQECGSLAKTGTSLA